MTDNDDWTPAETHILIAGDPSIAQSSIFNRFESLVHQREAMTDGGTSTERYCEQCGEDTPHRQVAPADVPGETYRCLACPERIEVEPALTVQSNTDTDRDIRTDGGTETTSRPGGAGKCPQGCHHPVAGSETLEYCEETIPLDPPEVIEVYGETVVQTERVRRYHECIVCGWVVDL